MSAPTPKPASKPYLVRTAVQEILANLTEGDPVPAERELAARFGVARETVRQALHELLVEGRIERRGRGTVVSKPKLTQPLSLKSYTEGAQTMGRKPGRLLVTFHDLDTTPELADGQRIGLESSYLPRHRFADLYRTFDPITSLYAAIRATGVVFGAAVERIETVLASPREAELLESTTAMPMLRLNRRSVDTEDRPIEVVRSLYRGDRVAFEARLTNR